MKFTEYLLSEAFAKRTYRQRKSTAMTGRQFLDALEEVQNDLKDVDSDMSIYWRQSTERRMFRDFLEISVSGEKATENYPATIYLNLKSAVFDAPSIRTVKDMLNELRRLKQQAKNIVFGFGPLRGVAFVDKNENHIIPLKNMWIEIVDITGEGHDIALLNLKPTKRPWIET